MSKAASSRERDHDDDGGSASRDGSQRLDKWLWFVRVIKTRTQAAGLVTDGKVRVNRERVDKPSQPVRPGDVVTVTVRGHVRVLKMVAAGERRGPPPEAQALYQDLTPPSVGRGERAPGSLAGTGVRAPGQGRPTKKERRQIDRLWREDE